ncbi:putative sugar transporter [Tilletiaria anomala UBC 951]|uniref:Quinate transporter n=1 Tax=Tilletiaria anomala (strain ATCC 24038 / CBS 436.72 / UBC 951) TaxID=1037660 RepID=A0A066V1J7_TILAU|nr:putative sugar transporter [Tilletiaria anomala UBC 951]KDN35582.1 putative sugar transporter [Tilletiaria anomala UBC 951]
MKLRTRFGRVEDTSPYPAPEEVYNWRIWAMMLSASMAAGMFGYDGAFIGSTLKLPAFKAAFGLNDERGAKVLAGLSSHIVSTFQAGCFVGTLTTYPLVERIGIRKCLFLASLIFNLGVVLQMAGKGSLAMIYAGRALTGVGVGNSYYVGPAYVSMNSPPAVRGRMVGLLETVYQAFGVVGFWICYGTNRNISPLSDAQWRIPVGLQFIPGVLLAVLMATQPEAPRWSIANGKREQGIRDLCYLRNLTPDHPYIAFEIQQIDEQLASERAGAGSSKFTDKLREAFGKRNRSRLAIGLAMMLFQNLSGINALNYYSATLIGNIGFKGTDVSLLATGVYGLEKALITLIFMTFFVDSVGRRKALILGSIGAATGMLYLGIYTNVADTFNSTPPRDAGAIFGLVAFYWYTLHYAYSWNGIPFMFCAEVFGNNIRMLCMTMTTCMQWIAQFMIVYSLPYMVVSIKSYTFIFFGVCTLAACAFTYLFVPETKGVVLEDMDVLFNARGLAPHQMKAFHQIMSTRAHDTVVAQGVTTVTNNEARHLHSDDTSGGDKSKHDGGEVRYDTSSP